MRNLIACYNMFHHLFLNIVTRTTNGSECLTALPSNCGGSFIKMGNKIWKKKFLLTAREEKNCSTSLLQHSTLIDIWNICAAELYLFDSNSASSLVMEILDICNGHWRIIWTHIHVYSLVIMFEYGWIPADRNSCRFMSKVKLMLFQSS